MLQCNNDVEAPVDPSIFDAMKNPMAHSTKFMTALQEQQRDNMETGMAVLACRDPQALFMLQQSYMQRTMDRWMSLAGTAGTTPFMPQVREAMEAMRGKTAAAPVAQPATVSPMPAKPVAAKPEASQPNAAAKPAPAKKAVPAAPKVVPTPPMATVSTVHVDAVRKDDLTAIKGIGPKFAETLNAHGIKTYKELAALTPAKVADLEEKLGFAGRFAREDWIAQAKSLAG